MEKNRTCINRNAIPIKGLMVKATNELIAKYESITIEVLNEDRFKDMDSSHIMKNLTGFSNMADCKLCIAARELLPNRFSAGRMYTYCIHHAIPEYEYSTYNVFETFSMMCTEDISYYDILRASSKEMLLLAIKARASYLKRLLNLAIEHKAEEERSNE